MLNYKRIVASIVVYAITGPIVVLNSHADVISDKELNLNQTLSLEQIVQKAIKNNPQVIAKRELEVAADADVEASEWQYYPSPSLEVQSYSGNETIALRLEQPLWTGGRLKADLDVATALRSVARATTYETQYMLAGQSIDAYGSFIKARQIALVIGKYIGKLEKLKQMMSRRVAAGYSGKVDENLIRVRLSQARNALLNAKESKLRSLTNLSYLIGIDISEKDVFVNFQLGDVELLNLSDSDLILKAIERNPRIKKAQREILVAAKQYEQAKHSIYPTLYARAEHLMGEDLVSSGDTDSRVVFGFRFDLGAGLSFMEVNRSAKARESASQYAKRELVNSLVQSIKSDLTSYYTNKELIIELSDHQEAQSALFESYRRMFLAGKRSWLDVLNVMREQMDAERNLVEAKINMFISLSRLRLNTGEVL